MRSPGDLWVQLGAYFWEIVKSRGQSVLETRKEVNYQKWYLCLKLKPASLKSNYLSTLFLQFQNIYQSFLKVHTKFPLLVHRTLWLHRRREKNDSWNEGNKETDKSRFTFFEHLTNCHWYKDPSLFTRLIFILMFQSYIIVKVINLLTRLEISSYLYGCTAWRSWKNDGFLECLWAKWIFGFGKTKLKFVS